MSETPKDVALNLVEEADELLVLVPNPDPEAETEWTYIWITPDKTKWLQPLAEFVKATIHGDPSA
jgi:hypothetical protein